MGREPRKHETNSNIRKYYIKNKKIIQKITKTRNIGQGCHLGLSFGGCIGCHLA
jgi:hypothetical protein